jgi:hypothetical protein
MESPLWDEGRFSLLHQGGQPWRSDARMRGRGRLPWREQGGIEERWRPGLADMVDDLP